MRKKKLPSIKTSVNAAAKYANEAAKNNPDAEGIKKGIEIMRSLVLTLLEIRSCHER